MHFLERMKQTIAKGYENASNLLHDAAEKTKELGERGVLEFEIKKLEKEVKCLLPLLGGEVYMLYRENRLKLIDDVIEIQKLLIKIHKLEIKISKKEQELKELKQ